MKFLVLVSIWVATESTDPCTRVSPTSFCVESGTCHGITNLTCEQAYVQVSQDNLVRIDKPAICKKISPVIAHAAKLVGIEKFSPTPIELPSSVSMTVEHEQFRIQLSALRLALESQFPYVVFDHKLAVGVLKAAIALGRIFITPDFPVVLYKTFWIDSTLLWDVLSNLKLLMKYTLSLDRDDLVRRSLFGNILPYFHLQLTLHGLLSIPPPFAQPEYLEFLTTAANYDPHYVLQDMKVWSILRPDELPRVVIPVISDESGLPPSVMDALGLNLDYNIDDAWQVAIEASNMMSQITDCERVLEYAQASVLLLIRHADESKHNSREEHCELYGYSWWTGIDQMTKKCPQYMETFKPIVTSMFRLCDSGFFALEDRVAKIFPLLVSPPRNATTSHFTIRYTASDVHQLRDFLYEVSWVTQSEITGQLWLTRGDGSTTSHAEHIHLLQEFMPHIWTLIPQLIWQISQLPKVTDLFSKLGRALLGAGLVTGLLLRERDPHGVLRAVIGSIPAPHSLTAWSYSVRRGFCRVVDCVGFDLVFDNTEILQMLDILQSTVS